MTREQIEAELKTFPFANLHPLTPDMTILFAHHIAKLVRNECAEICEDLHHDWHFGEESGPRACKRAILALNGEVNEHT